MQIFADKQFKNPIKIIEAFDNKSFIDAFSQIEDLRKSHYLLGYIRYEAKDVFLEKKIKSEYPLLYFEVYQNYRHCEEEQSPDAAIQEKKFRLLQLKLRNDINYKTYSNAIKQIKNEISVGNTYQVNYTFDYILKPNIYGLELYKQILKNQKTPYNVYIKNKHEEILSFSPELFFEIENNKIKTKPMKGTIKRGKTEKEDKNNIDFLKNDIKNRAENVMIVDLLRNDLGKIAKTSTVKVDKLFEIETHKTVHQMTSEISAELKENTTLFEIFEALFPCGSVTGAPKINTMEIIDKLEKGKREIYCGAIGLISPEKTVFSVPIRILQRQVKNNFYKCRVGGGIVWDSTAKDEWEETLTKIKFLNKTHCHCERSEASQKEKFGLPRRGNTPPRNDESKDFQLIETILVKNGKIQNKKAHFNRMKNSAKELNFKFNPDVLKIKPKKNGILRILLNKEGVFETQYLQFNKIRSNKVRISDVILNSKEPLLFHKTTFRPWYEATAEKIKKDKIFDEIFFNEKGELCEGSRSNIILQIGDNLFTPPVKCGLLNGVIRQNILSALLKGGRKNNYNKIHSDKGIGSSPRILEKKLYLEDVQKAEKIYCINAIRGIVEVELI